MIRDFRLLLRRLPDEGQLALPLDALDAVSRAIGGRISGSVWESTAHPPFHVVLFGSYLDGKSVHEEIAKALDEHPYAWLLRYDNRQESHGWSAVESLEWYRLFRTGTRD